MSTHPLAGKPAPRSMLVNVPAAGRRLLRDHARPGRCRAAGRVRDQRPPRLLAQGVVQRGPHPGHDASDLPLPDGAGRRRPAVSREGHARPVRAGLHDRPRGAGGQRGRGHGGRRGRLHADPGHLARHPGLQPPPHEPPRRWHRDHPVPQSPRGRRLQVQPAARRTGRHGGDRLDREEAPTSSWRATAARCVASPTPGRPRRRPRTRTTYISPYVADLGSVIDMEAIARRAVSRSASIRWAAPGSGTGSRSRSGTAGPRGGQPARWIRPSHS